MKYDCFIIPIISPILKVVWPLHSREIEVEPVVINTFYSITPKTIIHKYLSLQDYSSLILMQRLGCLLRRHWELFCEVLNTERMCLQLL